MCSSEFGLQLTPELLRGYQVFGQRGHWVLQKEFASLLEVVSEVTSVLQFGPSEVSSFQIGGRRKLEGDPLDQLGIQVQDVPE